MEERNYSIYFITNLKDNKLYVGISNNPERRWTAHKAHSREDKPNQFIHKAIKKHGIDSFSFDISESGLTRLEAINKELRLIELYNCRDDRFGYNQMRGGTMFPPVIKGDKHYMFGKKSDKLAELNRSRRGVKLSAERVEKLRLSTKGRKASEEELVKIRELNRAKWAEGGVFTTEEYRAKMRLAAQNRIGKYLGGGTGLKVRCNETGEEYVSLRQAALGMGLCSGGSIGKQIRGGQKTVQGFTFSFVEEDKN